MTVDEALQSAAIASLSGRFSELGVAVNGLIRVAFAVLLPQQHQGSCPCVGALDALGRSRGSQSCWRAGAGDLARQLGQRFFGNVALRADLSVSLRHFLSGQLDEILRGNDFLVREGEFVLVG